MRREPYMGLFLITKRRRPREGPAALLKNSAAETAEAAGISSTDPGETMRSSCVLCMCMAASGKSVVVSAKATDSATVKQVAPTSPRASTIACDKSASMLWWSSGSAVPRCKRPATSASNSPTRSAANFTTC